MLKSTLVYSKVNVKGSNDTKNLLFLKSKGINVNIIKERQKYFNRMFTRDYLKFTKDIK